MKSTAPYAAPKFTSLWGIKHLYLYCGLFYVSAQYSRMLGGLIEVFLEGLLCVVRKLMKTL